MICPEKLFHREDLSSVYDMPRRALSSEDLSSVYDTPREALSQIYFISI
jgi:hypothetical protein